MESLVSMTVFALGLALLTSFPAGAIATAVAAAALVLGLTLATFSGAVLGLAHLPADHD